MKQATEPSAAKHKKVLFLITKATWGGAQRYVFDLATHLPGEFEPVVAFGQAGKLSEDLAAQHIRTYPLPALSRDVAIWSDIQSFFQILKCIRSEKPDIIHLNSSKAAAIGALAARLAGVPKIIFTVHGWPFKEQRNFLSRAAIYCISWMTVMFAHATICVSLRDAETARWMAFISKRIRMIHNGIEIPDMLSRTDARSALVPVEIAARHEQDMWVGTIAELHPNKNLFTAIDVIQHYNDAHLPKIFYVIVGRGELHSRLESELTRRRVREQIMIVDFMPNIIKTMRAFDMFFLPSRKEGLPYVLLEAGAAALPVVASNAGGIAEIIEQSVSGIIAPADDTPAYVSALFEFAKDPEKRSSFGEALRQRVEREYALPRMVAETLALYSPGPQSKPLR